MADCILCNNDKKSNSSILGGGDLKRNWNTTNLIDHLQYNHVESYKKYKKDIDYEKNGKKKIKKFNRIKIRIIFIGNYLLMI